MPNCGYNGEPVRLGVEGYAWWDWPPKYDYGRREYFCSGDHKERFIELIEADSGLDNCVLCQRLVVVPAPATREIKGSHDLLWYVCAQCDVEDAKKEIPEITEDLVEAGVV